MKLRILGLSFLLLVGFLGAVVVLVRRSHSELEDLEAQFEEESDAVELMITPEDDHGPLLTVDDEDLIVHHGPVAVLEEEEEPTLASSLEKRVEEGEGNARLERRMKRKQQREMQEMASAPQGGLPPLPLPMPQPLPALDATVPAPQVPPPDLKREATCPSCNAAFGVKDLMLKRTTCPVCSTSFNL